MFTYLSIWVIINLFGNSHMHAFEPEEIEYTLSNPGASLSRQAAAVKPREAGWKPCLP